MHAAPRLTGWCSATRVPTPCTSRTHPTSPTPTPTLQASGTATKAAEGRAKVRLQSREANKEKGKLQSQLGKVRGCRPGRQVGWGARGAGWCEPARPFTPLVAPNPAQHPPAQHPPARLLQIKQIMEDKGYDHTAAFAARARAAKEAASGGGGGGGGAEDAVPSLPAKKRRI